MESVFVTGFYCPGCICVFLPQAAMEDHSFIHSFLPLDLCWLVYACWWIEKIGEETSRDKVNVYFRSHDCHVTFTTPHTCLLPTEKKKKQNLEVKNDVLFSGLAENLSPGSSLSSSSEELLWRGEWGASIYGNFCNKNQVAGTLKDYC